VRASDLLRYCVVEHDGTKVGTVTDLRVVQDGPIRGTQASFRVEALVVGRAGIAERLGYIRSRVRGPWILKVLCTRLERRAHVVDVADIEEWDEEHGTLRLRVGRTRVLLEPADLSM